MNTSISVNELLKPRPMSPADDCLSFTSDLYREYDNPEHMITNTIYFHGTRDELLRFFEWGVEACGVARTEPAPPADQPEESVNV